MAAAPSAGWGAARAACMWCRRAAAAAAAALLRDAEGPAPQSEPKLRYVEVAVLLFGSNRCLSHHNSPHRPPEHRPNHHVPPAAARTPSIMASSSSSVCGSAASRMSCWQKKGCGAGGGWRRAGLSQLGCFLWAAICSRAVIALLLPGVVQWRRPHQLLHSEHTNTPTSPKDPPARSG